jgi:hypothetical protein
VALGRSHALYRLHFLPKLNIYVETIPTQICNGWTKYNNSMSRYHVVLRSHVDCVWNVIAHAQKTDFVFRRNGRVHLNRQGTSVQSTTGSRGVRISGSNAGYIMFRGSAKSTGYPLHSPVSPSLLLPCVTVCHHISTGVYYWPTIETVRMCEGVENHWNNNGWQYFIWGAPNGRAPAEIVGSNLTRGIDVFLLWVVCVDR